MRPIVLPAMGMLVHLAAAEAVSLPPQQWRVIPASSTVVFHGASTLHEFDGTATVASGQLDLIPGQEAGVVCIAASSMKTGNDDRDRTLQTEQLESARFPTITFTLGRLERTGTTAIAHGIWSMHGVDRHLDLAVILPSDPTPAGAKAHLTSSFSIDMRLWNIKIPRTAQVIAMDPLVTVAVDLALEPASGPQGVIPRARPLLGNLALLDQRGVSHALASEGAGRLLMLFDIDERITAKRCDDVLSRRLDPTAPLLRIIDGSRFAPEDRETLRHRLQESVKDPTLSFLLDWEGDVRKRFKLPDAPLLFLGFAPDGVLVGECEGELEIPTLTRILALIGRPANPPFVSDELNALPKRGR
jgi:polyisoprenoid-binding protein YceI